MADKICHLCGTHYFDDPFLTEHPGHTPEQCLRILGYRISELELKLLKVKGSLIRAKKTYRV